MYAPQHQGAAVITGATSRLGAQFAERLGQRGYDLILIAADAERLRSQARRLTDLTRRSVETLAVDLADPKDLARAERQLRLDSSITLLLNNASRRPARFPMAQEIEAVIGEGARAPARMVQALAPGFVARGSGTIINLAAAPATSAFGGLGLYDGARAFMLGFSQALHRQLASQGVRVQAILPSSGGEDADARRIAEAGLAGLDLGELVTWPD